MLVHHKSVPDNQWRLEWLTTTVSIWGLGRSILQAVQDFSFTHITVSDQKELEQVVVTFHWAALAAHRVSHLSPGAAEDEDGWLKIPPGPTDGWVRNQHPCLFLHTPNQNRSDVCYPMNLLNGGPTTATVFKIAWKWVISSQEMGTSTLS